MSNSKVSVTALIVISVCLIFGASQIYMTRNSKEVLAESAMRPMEETINDLVYIGEGNVALAANPMGDADTIAAVKVAFENINKFRVENGIAPLAWSEKLEKAAEIRAQEVSQKRHFEHKRPDGSDFWAVLPEAVFGEVISKGFRAGEAVVESWKESESNKQALLNANFKSVGIYIFHEENSNWYWAAEFGV